MRIKKFIQDLFGITQIIKEKRKQTELLKKIADHCRQTENLLAGFQLKTQYEAPKFELVQMFNRSTSAAILYSTC